jgi:hypothetical protein
MSRPTTLFGIPVIYTDAPPPAKRLSVSPSGLTIVEYPKPEPPTSPLDGFMTRWAFATIQQTPDPLPSPQYRNDCPTCESTDIELDVKWHTYRVHCPRCGVSRQLSDGVMFPIDYVFPEPIRQDFGYEELVKDYDAEAYRRMRLWGTSPLFKALMPISTYSMLNDMQIDVEYELDRYMRRTPRTTNPRRSFREWAEHVERVEPVEPEQIEYPIGQIKLD